MNADSASAYEIHADAFLKVRDVSSVGADIALRWARSLEPNTEVLEIGCGGGLPVSRAVIDSGHRLWAVDASPTLLKTFGERFPEVPVDCAHALESNYFNRSFGAVIAVGLMFLLSDEEQSALIHRVAEVLRPGGRFLFTAPTEIGDWKDVITGCECHSLGQERYSTILVQAGFRVMAGCEDEGRNHYYEAERV